MVWMTAKVHCWRTTSDCVSATISFSRGSRLLERIQMLSRQIASIDLHLGTVAENQRLHPINLRPGRIEQIGQHPVRAQNDSRIGLKHPLRKSLPDDRAAGRPVTRRI